MLGITNWKTTLSGIATILTALAAVAHGFSVSDMKEIYAAIPMIVTGIGLIAAKDSEVTGGSVPQTKEAVGRATSTPLSSLGKSMPK